MNTLDIVLLCCLIPALIQGLKQGFIEQVVALASIFVSTWLAFKYSTTVALWLADFITADEKVLHIAAFIIVVFVAILLLTIVGKLFAKVFQVATLGWLDKILGILLAILKTVLVLGLIAILFDSLNERFFIVEQDKLMESKVYVWIRDFSLQIFPYFREWFSNADINV